MTSLLVEQPGCLGDQRPRVFAAPPSVSSAGPEAVELARITGLDLDPWQQFVLSHSLGERADQKFSAFEVGVVVARQNGKGGILEARELAGLFLLGERLIIHSAHQFDTSLEAFRRLLALIEDTPDLDRRVKRVSRSHGEEGIELKSRQRIRFRTRTKGGGRGFTADCVIFDEAMDLPEAVQGAVLPTLSARPNPQVWYTASAVDQEVHEHGIVLARVRQRGLTGGDPALAFFEWSVDPDEFKANPGLATDVRAWGQANPGLGIRIGADYVAKEQRTLAPKTFAVERLSVGDWPATDDTGGRVIDRDAWRACADPLSAFAGPPVFAVDVTPDRAYGSIATAGTRPDGLPHVEVVDHRGGVGWIVGRCAELAARHRKALFVLDERGPASSFIADLREARLKVVEVNGQSYAQACGDIFDTIADRQLRYPAPQPELGDAVDGVKTRTLGDAWAWSRKSSAVDISPLVAATLALWGVGQAARRPRPGVVDLAAALAAAADAA